MRCGRRPTRPHAHDSFVYITKISHLLKASGEVISFYVSNRKELSSDFMGQVVQLLYTPIM